MKKYNLFYEDNNEIPYSKWIVALRIYKNHKPTIILRQFYAKDFYEAFDIVSTFSEKTHLPIVWYKEKTECDGTIINKSISMLESICVYCNRMFNEIEPIPCKVKECSSTFCSRDCLTNHLQFKHKY